MAEQLTYSGTQFLSDLDKMWGGRLYFALKPQYGEAAADITPFSYTSLRTVFDINIATKPTITSIGLSGDITSDVREHLIDSTPHPEEAEDRLHILADPFCRAHIIERLETFLVESCRLTLPEGEFVIEDELPFCFEGLKSDVFSTPFILRTIGDYFDVAKAKAAAFAQQVDLTDQQRAALAEEIRRGMDRFKLYIQMGREGRDRDLHPIIQVLTSMAELQFECKRKGISFS